MSDKPNLTEAELAAPLRHRDLSWMMGVVAKALRDYLAISLEPLVNRVRALEANAQMSYKGVWETDRPYKVGNIVTQAGAMWTCCADNLNSRPPGSAWQLCVKRGAASDDKQHPYA
jgi:hypothetical protein